MNIRRPWFLTWQGFVRAAGLRYALISFPILLVFSALIGLVSREIIWSQVQREQVKPVERVRNGLMAVYRYNGKDALVAALKARTRARRTVDVAILLAAPNGRLIVGNIDRWPSNLSGNEGRSYGEIRMRGAPQPEYMGVTVSYLDDGSRLLLGVPVLSKAKIDYLHWQVLGISALLAIGFAFFFWFVTAQFVAHRLRGLRRVAELCAEGRFSERLAISGSGDRFDQFLTLVNASLDRIEPMVEEIKVVTTGLAHDIRSPLSRIRLSVERAASETDDPATDLALKDALRDIDQLLAMLTKTMEIAQANANTTPQRFEQCDLAAMLHQLAEMYLPLAEEQGFRIVVQADNISLPLHRHLFQKAMANLIENALNYAYGGSRIEIGAKHVGDHVEVRVADNGPGIPEHRFEDALRRYGRLDPARHVPGTGLGLSIVDAVARMHRGTVALSSNRPGLCVTMYLPTTSPS